MSSETRISSRATHRWCVGLHRRRRLRCHLHGDTLTADEAAQAEQRAREAGEPKALSAATRLGRSTALPRTALRAESPAGVIVDVCIVDAGRRREHSLGSPPPAVPPYTV